MVDLNKLFEAIVKGKLETALEITKQAITEKISPEVIINDYMVKGMEEIGARFEAGEAFVPNLLMSARAMKGPLVMLKPMLKKDSDTILGKVVIGTVKGDLHDIGKNLVASMLEGCGFDVVNLGVDVSSSQFVESLIEENGDILCMSALLTTTMNYMKDVIEALKEANIRNKVKVMIGGAPLTENFAKSIGADGYSANANEAVILARSLISVD